MVSDQYPSFPPPPPPTSPNAVASHGVIESTLPVFVSDGIIPEPVRGTISTGRGFAVIEAPGTQPLVITPSDFDVVVTRRSNLGIRVSVVGRATPQTRYLYTSSQKRFHRVGLAAVGVAVLALVMFVLIRSALGHGSFVLAGFTRAFVIGVPMMTLAIMALVSKLFRSSSPVTLATALSAAGFNRLYDSTLLARYNPTTVKRTKTFEKSSVHGMTILCLGLGVGVIVYSVGASVGWLSPALITTTIVLSAGALLLYWPVKRWTYRRWQRSSAQVRDQSALLYTESGLSPTDVGANDSTPKWAWLTAGTIIASVVLVWILITLVNSAA